MKVELAQIKGRDGDTAYNLTRALEVIATCAVDTELLILPETYITGFPTKDNIAILAEPLNGPSIQSLHAAAKPMIQGRHIGRVVLVSGAASGIGAAIALRYCEEGASVALLDRDPESLKAQADAFISQGFTVAYAIADVGNFEQCQSACTQLGAQLGPIDTLINNAGISPKKDGKPCPIWQMEPKEWLNVVDVNLNGSFNLARLLTPSMVEKRFGRVVNMSSVAGSAYLPLVANQSCGNWAHSSSGG
ncbi:3-ketoacyl-ACP reductase [Pseudomonas syringae pv. spinaceae]|uniref:3-ketoacyl-ACP reductase n=1 Tax=Pseudomonas syringae pv. spinaceae TaxID=264459 RepID=A0A0Q0CTU0_PSESX|nr:SDR family NAD(P)-dependent oxidoreductase [Pseudomonas syringae]KPZ09227.1 3-ketoacyl-ACP reductase [Pseudomonas syringae pv. spinaceae]RMT31368.1 3-ketoacyl-ACP reductase [Pseudomonas syringae pv. spinaceae]